MRAPTICCLAFGAGLFAGGAQADTTLDVVYAFPNNYKKVQEEIASRFETANPGIKIKYRSPATNYDTALAQVLRESIIGETPDVFFTGGNYMRVLADQKLAVPLDTFVESPGQWQEMGYLDSMLSLGRLNGKIYGLPFATSIPVLYVNLDIVKKAGGSVEKLPQDWGELARFGQQMSKQGEDVIGFYHDYAGAGNFNFQVLLNSNGGVMGSEDGCTVAFNGPEGMRALQTLEMFVERGMPKYSQNQIRQAFAAGNVGIWMSSTSKIAQMEKASAGTFGFRVLPYPLPTKQGRLPAGGAIAVMTTKDAKKQAAAWKFIAFATGPIGQTLVAEYTGYMPNNKKAVDDPKLLGRFYEKNPNKLVGVQQMPVLTGWYNWAGKNSVKIVDVIQKHVDSVAFGKRKAKDVMPEMAEDVQKLLAKACSS